jgi:hypothetical protein
MSKVSRSTYQKVAEENKRLLADIKILVGIMDERYLEVYGKWIKHFKEKKQFNDIMVWAAKEYIKKHPEYDITKYTPRQDERK